MIGPVHSDLTPFDIVVTERDRLLVDNAVLADELLAIWHMIKGAEFEDIDDDNDLVVLTIQAPQARRVRAVLKAHGPAPEGPHKCARCGDPNPEHLDRDGCRDPDCPEQESTP